MFSCMLLDPGSEAQRAAAAAAAAATATAAAAVSATAATWLNTKRRLLR